MIIRAMRPSEYGTLKDFLYDAIFIPEGVEPPDRSIVNLPELAIYYEGFGTGPADICVTAEEDGGLVGAADGGSTGCGRLVGAADGGSAGSGRLVGAAWSRIMEDYGHVDDETPSIAISVKEPFRAQGIGTALLDSLAEALAAHGFHRVSLAVQKANYAVRMYEKAGFRTIRETEEEYIMLKEIHV